MSSARMTDDHDPYTPINCDLHSQYELAVMHQQKLHLGWHDRDGMYHIGAMKPLDMQTRLHAEYLLAEDTQGQVYEIRLDKISHSDVGVKQK